MKRILISGWYGFGNIGDEAILQAMIDKFKKEYKDCDITVLSFKPKYTKKVQKVKTVLQIPATFRLYVKSIITFGIIKALLAFYKCDIFVMGGGGFLSDWQPEVPHDWLKQFKLAKLFGKETWLYGIGAGPFSTDEGRNTTKYYIDNFVDKVTVRDEISYHQLVQNVGISESKVTLTCDPVTEWEIDPVRLPKEQQGLVGVILTPYFDKELWGDQRNKWSQLYDCYVSMLKEIISENQSVRLIFFQKNVEFELGERLLRDVEDCSVCYPDDYFEAVKYMSECESIISFRLHGNILAYVLNKPFLPIVYHHKTHGFIAGVGYKLMDDIIEVGDGINWKDNDIRQDVWIDKTHKFLTAVKNKVQFYEK